VSGRFGRYARELVAGWDRPEVSLLVVGETDSTNALAWRLHRARDAREGFGSSPLAVLAWSQGEGRGRRGRAWASPAGGGVYASLLVPAPRAGETELLPLRVAAAVCRRLDRWTRRPCRLKWPNDLLVEGAKIGGVLVESATSGGVPSAAVAGFGVNLEPLADPPDGARATSLRERADSVPTLADLAAELLGEVVDELRQPARAERAAAEYERLSLHREGDRLSCRTPAGDVRGIFCGFDERGFLRLRSAGGLRVVAAGELVEGATS
jgi:BirA family biotin operon repressor/biotin-[acetyl-CoA-carboxylase] ligase